MTNLPAYTAELALNRTDLMPLEAQLCQGLSRFFTFKAHSLYFPKHDTAQAEYLAAEEKLFVPLRSPEGNLLAIFVARGVPQAEAEAILPLLPAVAATCLENLQFYKQSRLEPTSGLLNRRSFIAAVSRELAGLRGLLQTSPGETGSRRSGQFSLMAIRLGKLAAVVREEGYIRTDELVSALGKTLAKITDNLAPQPVVSGRSGDYEFSLLLPAYSPAATQKLGLQIATSLGAAHIKNPLTGKRIKISPSVGFVNCPRDLDGLERQEPAEQARQLLRRARLAAAIAAMNARPGLPPEFADKARLPQEETRQPVMAYSNILREGGRVISQRPLSRLMVSLGRTAGARPGQLFTVWGYALGEQNTLHRHYKADIMLIDVFEGESLAEIIHADDASFPPEAGDFLILGASRESSAALSAAYPDDKTSETNKSGVDFLPRWSLEREKHDRFAVVLSRFSLSRQRSKDEKSAQEETETSGQPKRQDSDASLEADNNTTGNKTTGSGAAGGDATENDTTGNVATGSGADNEGGEANWEELMAQAMQKCKAALGETALAGRFALNSLIFFVPDPHLESTSVKASASAEKDSLTETLAALSDSLKEELGLDAAFGVAPHPFLDFHKADSLENAKKALEYALLLPKPHVGVLDSLALNISADRKSSLGDQLGAIHEYRQALICDPDNILAWNSLGVVLAGLGQYKEARESLEEALERAPNDYNTLYNLGNLQQSRRDFNDAKKFYLRCLKLEPQNIFILYRLGQIAEQQNNYAEAESYYRKATELPGGATMTRRGLARLAIRQGRLEEAREELHEALLQNPHDALAMQILAGLYLDAGEDTQVAESLARQSVSLRPDLRSAWLVLARALEATGRKEDAREALIRAGEL